MEINLRKTEKKVTDAHKLMREYKAMIRDSIEGVLDYDPSYKDFDAIKRLIAFSGYEVKDEHPTEVRSKSNR